MRFYLTLVKMAIIKKKTNNNVGEDMEKSELLCTVDGNVRWCSHYGKQYGDSSKKLKITAIKSSNPTPWYLPEENKNTDLNSYTHPYVHCSTIYNSQDMEAT